jgi:hypothetical protein
LKKIRAVLNKQKPALLVCIEALIELRKKEQTEEEAKIQEKLKKIGRSFFVSLLPRVQGACVPPVSRAHPSFRSWRPYFVVKGIFTMHVCPISALLKPALTNPLV